MSVFGKLFGSDTQSAVAVILDRQLPSGDPEAHGRILDAILRKAGVKASRPAHTILSPGIRDRSRLITAKVCERHFRETMGSAYDESSLTIIPFDAPDAGTSGVIVAHP
jgi:hypothetical protein